MKTPLRGPLARAPRLCGWALFIAGMGLLYLSDYALHKGRPSMEGLPELIWFGVPIGLGIGSLALVWQGAKQRERQWLAALEMLAHASVGVLLYIITTLWYVLEAGVDSL
jgi:apolipoprotein N-acyltransferase